MLIAFAASASGRGLVHHAAGELVLHVSTKDAVFNQHITARRNALIVHIQRSAPVCHSAVVHNSAQRTCNPLSNTAAESRYALSVEICFKTVSYRLVQQDARPPRPQYHSHLARRSFHCIQLNDGLASSFAGVGFRAGVSVEEIERHAPTAAGITGLGRAYGIASQDRYTQACQGLLVEAEDALARSDQYVPEIICIHRLDFENALVECSRCFISPAHQGDALLQL